MTTLVLADLLRDQRASCAELVRDNPDASDAIFGTLRAEHRDKPSYPIGDSTDTSGTQAAIINGILERRDERDH